LILSTKKYSLNCQWTPPQTNHNQEGVWSNKGQGGADISRLLTCLKLKVSYQYVMRVILTTKSAI
jgi:hypothetical protein